MLIALLLSYVLSGSGAPFSGVLTSATLKDLSNRVATAVTDPARAQRAEKTLSNARGDVTAFEKAYAESGKNLSRYYREHEQNGALMGAEINKLERRWEAAQAKVLALRFELQSNLTREEWQQVFPQQQLPETRNQ